MIISIKNEIQMQALINTAHYIIYNKSTLKKILSLS